MKINGITLTEDAIMVIRRIQEGESQWMIDTLEKITDLLLQLEANPPSDKQKLEILEGVRSIEKEVITVLAVNNKEGDQT